jgi:glycosyltransferase involved in cell wall biosynthesis
MTPLRFCLLTTFYPPFNFGGDGIDVQRTARALVARGHQVTVIHEVDAYQSLSERRPPPQPVWQDGVEVIGLRSWLRVISPILTHQFGRPVVHGPRIERLLAERRPDVIVFNNVSLVGGPGLLALGDALKIYLAHEHWLVCPTHVLWRFNREPCPGRKCTRCVLSYRRPPQLWRYADTLQRQFRHVDLFIARSEFSRRKHHEFGFGPPMRVLPYFLPADMPDPTAAPPSPRPHDRPYFLFVGRLTRIKGLEEVILAMGRHPRADLLIIGDGDDRASLGRLAQDRPNVRFLGWLPNDQVGRYYEHALASIVPSVGFETFGIVLIEAFHHRTPVIARRIGPFPEIVERSGGGLLFDHPEELLQAMDRLQRDATLRESLAAAGHRACRDLWSEPVVINQFLEFVDEALEARASRLRLLGDRGLPA